MMVSSVNGRSALADSLILKSMPARASRVVAMAAAACALFGAASASAAPIDAAKSSVITTSKQMSVAVDGKFKKFSGDVTFDPANPAAGSAKVNIDIGSYDIGSDEYNSTLKSAEWFDSAKFPQATFVSTSIAAAGPGKLSVKGKLTIKGKTNDITVPLSYTVAGTTQTFDGVASIKRLAYGIGANEWKDTSVVADEVDIKFHLVVTK
jgi:polyisoprenoid-binding protein YceI